MRFKFSYSVISALIIGSLLFIYIFIKAYNSSFTHDESYSYLRYVHISFMDIISHKNSYTNNHLLNSLFMKYSEMLFGSSEISLRLPNLILLLVFMIYGFILFRKTNQLLVLAIFIILCTNNTLIDLFGLARGYGLSCGFMLMSVYHFIQSFYAQKTKNIILFHLGGLLAILSNFTLLDFYTALLLIYNLVVFIEYHYINKNKFNFFKTNKVNAIPFLCVVAVLYEPVRRVISNNNLDFGGKNGFYNDTIKQLINYCFHTSELSPIVFFIGQLLFTAIVLISLNIIIRKINQGDTSFFLEQKGLIISNFLLIFISLEIVIQHILLKADYPILRFSIFLFPLFIIHLGFLLSYLSTLQYQKGIQGVMLSIAIISSISFVFKADLRSCAEWEYDMETKTMMNNLIDYHNKNKTNDNLVRIGINWLFEPTINFYRQTKNVTWLIEADRNGIKKTDDYYYIFKDQLKELDSLNYKVISEFNRINTVLIKNNKVQ